MTFIISPEAVWLDFEASDKTEAIKKLCFFAADLKGLDSTVVHKVVNDRELLGSTAVGGGVALPHGKTTLLDNIFMVLARTAPGLNLQFDSPDRQPIRLMALILSPETATSEHLKILAFFGRLWKSTEDMDAILTAKDRQTFCQVFRDLAL
jgi:PTS system nitrogen regulatory IIA component